MKYKDKLIKIMQMKKEILDKNLKIDSNYTNHKIEDYIRTWENDKCKRIFEKFVENVNCNMQGLRADVCIFCIENNNDCKKCFYGEINGICNRRLFDKLFDNSYGFICNMILKEELDIYEILSKNVYLKIIEEVNK